MGVFFSGKKKKKMYYWPNVAVPQTHLVQVHFTEYIILSAFPIIRWWMISHLLSDSDRYVFFFWIIFFVFYKVTISMRELFCIMRATPCCICLSVAKRSYGRYNNFREHVYLHRPRYSMMYWILQNVYILIIHECWALSWFVVLVKSISFAWKGVRLNVG